MGETNPSWKWLSRRKTAPGGAKRGTCLKLSCLLKPSTRVSAAETVLWLEKGNSWGSATRINSAISADYINCSPRKKWVLRSPLEHQLLSPHPCTHLPAPLPGNNHHRWLCNNRLTMRVSLGRMYPCLQCPPPLPHKHHLVLSKFCITLWGSCATGLLCSSGNWCRISLSYCLCTTAGLCVGVLGHFGILRVKVFKHPNPKWSWLKWLGSLHEENGIQATQKPMAHILPGYVAHPFSRPWVPGAGDR